MQTKQVKDVGLDEFDLRAFQFESYDFKELRFLKVLAGCKCEFEFTVYIEDEKKKVHCASQLAYFHISMYYIKEFWAAAWQVICKMISKSV